MLRLRSVLPLALIPAAALLAASAEAWTPLPVVHAAPILMTNATIGMVPGPCEITGSDGTPCDDGDPCTVDDACMGGTCQGGGPKVCAPISDCHDAGVCNSADGICSTPAKPDGSPCPGGGTCMGGQCLSSGTGGMGGSAEGGMGGAATGGGSPTGVGGDGTGGTPSGLGGPDLSAADDGGCGCETVGRHAPSDRSAAWWLLLLLPWWRRGLPRHDDV